MLDFVKMMAAAGCDIKPYLDCGTITQAEFDKLSGAGTEATPQ